MMLLKLVWHTHKDNGNKVFGAVNQTVFYFDYSFSRNGKKKKMKVEIQYNFVCIVILAIAATNL